MDYRYRFKAELKYKIIFSRKALKNTANSKAQEKNGSISARKRKYAVNGRR